MSETASSPRLGFIGLGLMGDPMCRNLLRAGFELVVFNRTASKTEALKAAGAAVAPTVGELTERSDIVLACLGTVEASNAAFCGPGGVIDHARAGQLLVDLGTIGPDVASRIGARAVAAGADFLDAPVSGGPEGAAAGTLTIMVGGSAEGYRRAEPVLRSLGRNLHHLGAIGAGSLAKLVNQLLTLVHGAVAAEAVALGVRAGADPARLLEVLRTGFGQSTMLERNVPRVVAGSFQAGAPLRLAVKDWGLLRDLAARDGAEIPLGEAMGRVLDRAEAAGMADLDIAALYRLYAPKAPGRG